MIIQRIEINCDAYVVLREPCGQTLSTNYSEHQKPNAYALARKEGWVCGFGYMLGTPNRIVDFDAKLSLHSMWWDLCPECAKKVRK